jgi:hypothetical protein
MKTASIHELKKELSARPPSELLDACIRLAKFKKDNKELLTFLLWEAQDLVGYSAGIREEISSQMELLPSNHYLMKKALRKVLRTTNKYIRYAGSKELEVELLLFFCTTIREKKVPVQKSTQMTNLFEQQLKKIRKAVLALHDDLRYDYLKQLGPLERLRF